MTHSTASVVTHALAAPSPATPSLVIVGGGFSGAVAALKVIAAAEGPVAITVIEPAADLGAGIAYGTRDPAHFLNAPAKIVSLHPEHAGHFTEWLAARPDAFAGPGPAEAFARRGALGAYVRDELARALAAAPRARLDHVRAEAVDLRVSRDGVAVTLDDGRTVGADRALLATGLVGARPPIPGADTLGPEDGYIADPFDAASHAHVPADGTVLHIGTSLTMLDSLVTLERRGFRGLHLGVSRHGFLPQERREPPAWPDFLGAAPLPATARALLARVRRELALLAAQGGDWQAIVPAIRPHVPALWAGASDAERARFLRHLRRYWENALHRSPGPSHATFRAVAAQGRFTAEAGRVTGLAREGGRLVATVAARGGAVRPVAVDAVVNNLGWDYSWIRAGAVRPLARTLIARGLVRPGPLGSGLDADAAGGLIGRDGTASGRLFGIGPVLRGRRWESNTVMEILTQAIALAPLLARAENAVPAASAA
ncbi:FAD/NAD(P)-binding protein [Methylobacterium sp. ID0610]|uniref:FAD/NAD(P)-binding protein n=1 Tax=Methylobacterium carpenticola TaxID=3344827 RepID=UPI0036A0C8FE